MISKELRTWEDFECAVVELDRELEEKKARSSDSGVDVPVFRGQGNRCWKLKTTLDRVAAGRAISVLEYYQDAARAQSQIEALTDRKWESTLDEYQLWKDSIDLQHGGFISSLPALEYLVYLRHHGFPSPLLDWTESPYVAAYFAFRSPPGDAEYVSVFSYTEFEGHVKASAGSGPRIKPLEKYVRAHKRHFLQQCQYTICYLWDQNEMFFHPHDGVAGRNEASDVLRRFDLPVTERSKALRKLGRMNINAYSLFGSEDSLLEKLALETFT